MRRLGVITASVVLVGGTWTGAAMAQSNDPVVPSVPSVSDVTGGTSTNTDTDTDTSTGTESPSTDKSSSVITTDENTPEPAAKYATPDEVSPNIEDPTLTLTETSTSSTTSSPTTSTTNSVPVIGGAICSANQLFCDASGNLTSTGLAYICSLAPAGTFPFCPTTGTGTNTATATSTSSSSGWSGYGDYTYWHHYNRCYYDDDWYHDCFGDNDGRVVVKTTNKYYQSDDTRPTSQVTQPKGGVNTGDGSVG